MIAKTLKPLALAIIVGLSSCIGKIDTQRVSIIPQPVRIKGEKGEFTIDPSTILVYNDDNLAWIASYASNLWKQYLGYPLQQSMRPKEQTSNYISIKINSKTNDIIGDEGYTLKIKNDRVSIAANTRAGALYGVQTFYQLLSTNPKGIIPCLSITDYPRFAYRGMHLDVARHFHPVDFIYKMIDYMAMHKINRFHWHLVDDQGWRLEIKKHPKLTEVGAWRADLSDRHWNNRPLEAAKGKPTTYGGFYTQDEVKAVVAYAAERNITVMPEIEMPAHVMSALAAYPELISLYDDDDVRGSLFRTDENNVSGSFWTTKYIGKGDGDALSTPDANNVIVIRLSEMYLNRAEALINGASIAGATALADLNIIRQNRGASALSSAGADIVFQERRKELAFEGHIWFDYARTNRALSRTKSDGSLVSIASDDNRWALPIPKRELDVNENLIQNDGY